MPAVSRDDPAVGITDEHEQRIRECRSFLAEFGARATMKRLQKWQSGLQPEAAAMKNLLGVVALMATSGTQPETTWAHVVQYVRQNAECRANERKPAAGLGSKTTETPKKCSRKKKKKNVALGVNDFDAIVGTGEPLSSASRDATSLLPAVEPFAAAVTSGKRDLETSGANSLGNPETLCSLASRAAVSFLAPYGVPSKPHRTLAAAGPPPAAEWGRDFNRFFLFSNIACLVGVANEVMYGILVSPRL